MNSITRWDDPLRDEILLDVDGWSQRRVTSFELRAAEVNDLVALVYPWVMYTVAAGFPCHDEVLR